VTEGIQPGIGHTLREAREARGLGIAEVAEKLKLTARQIEALENEDYGRLPALVFVRGFIRNYARLLDISPESLLGAGKDLSITTETITAPTEGLKLGASPIKRWVLLPLAGFALFLLLVAGLYTWLKRGEEAYVANPPAMQPIDQPITLPQAITPTVEATPLATPLPTPLPSAVATPAAAPTRPPLPTHLPLPATPTPSPPPAPAAQTARPVAESTLQFQADEDAWIEVVSGDNRRFARLMRAGELVTLRGVPPFNMVVGNAAHVRMGYNSRAIDLRPYIGDKVARLTLE
jgi:cytoskeleton protein RodZ